MLRADYERFLRDAPPLLDSRLFLQTWRSDPHFPSCFAKLRRHDSAFKETCFQHSRQHHGIYLDLFPFDPVWPERWWWRGLLIVVRGIRKILLRLQSLAGDGTNDETPPTGWMALHEGLLGCLARVPSNQVVCLANGSLRWQRLRALTRPIAEFEQTVRLPFEGMLLPVTAFHDHSLSRLYGDYRRVPPPERRRPGHPVVDFRLPED